MKPSPPMTRIKRFEDEVEGEEVCELLNLGKHSVEAVAEIINDDDIISGL